MNDTEKKENDQLKWHHYLISVLFVLVGAVFIVYAQIDIPTVCKVLSIVFGLAGVISILSYCIKDVAVGYFRLDLVYGVMALVVALLFITDQDAIGAYFPVIAGIILIANGVIKLQHSIDMKRIDRKMKKVTEVWLVVMIFALIGIAAGFISVYLTLQDRTMFVLIGIALIVGGLSDIFTHIVFNKKVKAFRSGDYLTAEETHEAAAQPEEPVTIQEEVTEQEAEPEQVPEPAVPDQDQVVFEVESSEENTDAADQNS